jgi:hypothetical protein
VRHGFTHLLREVVFNPNFFDGIQLRFQPVDMVLFIGKNLHNQFTGTVIARLGACFHPFIQSLDGVVFSACLISSIDSFLASLPNL